MNLAIISQCPVLASTPQALFLPKTLSAVRAHHLQVRFCYSNRRGQECVGWVKAALSAGCGHQKGDESLQFVFLPHALEGMQAADTHPLPIHAPLAWSGVGADVQSLL